MFQKWVLEFAAAIQRIQRNASSSTVVVLTNFWSKKLLAAGKTARGEKFLRGGKTVTAFDRGARQHSSHTSVRLKIMTTGTRYTQVNRG